MATLAYRDILQTPTQNANQHFLKQSVLPPYHSYYPWHYGAWDFFLDLGLETMTYLRDLIWLFCLEFLRFTSRHWVSYLFLCAGFFVWLHSLFVIWNSPVYSRYSAQFCEDLIHLKFGSIKRFSIFSCLVSIQGIGILSWLIMSSIGFLLVRWFLSIAFI